MLQLNRAETSLATSASASSKARPAAGAAIAISSNTAEHASHTCCVRAWYCMGGVRLNNSSREGDGVCAEGCIGRRWSRAGCNDGGLPHRTRHRRRLGVHTQRRISAAAIALRVTKASQFASLGTTPVCTIQVFRYGMHTGGALAWGGLYSFIHSMHAPPRTRLETS